MFFPAVAGVFSTAQKLSRLPQVVKGDFIAIRIHGLF
jgi:hypothetical protein